MRTKDRLIAPSRGSAGQAKAYGISGGAHRPDGCRAYVQTVYDLCAQPDMIDASIVVAQSLQETSDPGPWQSYWWTTRLNPAGLGITGDPVENAQSPTFQTGEEAARAQVSHLLLYATGTIDRGGLTPADDPRYAAYVQAYGNVPMAETIAELAGTWAMDPLYAQGIVRRGNDCFAGLPDQETNGGTTPVADITFGKVPHPDVDIRDIPNNTAWDNLGKRTVRAIVYHRMLGSLWGTDGYFRGEGSSRALTDYGVGVAAQDGADEAGHLLRWNDPRGQRSPWANGQVSAPYGDGEKFIALYGVNGVNRDATAIEISGFQTTPLDDKARQRIAELSAYWADQYKLPYTTYPHILSENNRSFVIWHQEFTIGTGKECPFQVVMDETDALIARTKAILQKYQTGETATATTTTAPARPDYAEPRKPPEWDGSDKEAYGEAWLACRRHVTATKATKRLQKFDAAGPVVGPPIAKGTDFAVDWKVQAKAGGFFVTPAGTVVGAGNVTPVVTIKDRESR